jgi:hypothetical protein
MGRGARRAPIPPAASPSGKARDDRPPLRPDAWLTLANVHQDFGTPCGRSGGCALDEFAIGPSLRGCRHFTGQQASELGKKSYSFAAFTTILRQLKLWAKPSDNSTNLRPNQCPCRSFRIVTSLKAASGISMSILTVPSGSPSSNSTRRWFSSRDSSG